MDSGWWGVFARLCWFLEDWSQTLTSPPSKRKAFFRPDMRKMSSEETSFVVDGNIIVVTSYNRLKMYDIEDCLFIKTSKRSFLWWMPNELTKQLSCKACCAANMCGRKVGFRKRKIVRSAEGLVYLALELLLMPRVFNCKWFTNQGIFGSWGGYPFRLAQQGSTGPGSAK